MNYILDTHALIWFFTNSSKMPNHIYQIIEDPNNRIIVSSISLLELTIKISKHKIDLGVDIDELYHKVIQNHFHIVQIEIPYLMMYKQLPFIHKDPYDRLLIATAKANNLTLITHDENIHKYDVKWLW